MKILAIIPAYNEEQSIASVINALAQNKRRQDIIVINDGSTDRTSTCAKATGKAFVIDLPYNLGIGGAVQTGFKFAARNNYDIAFQFDGDGQHRVSDIETILSPVLEKKADVVIGSRFIGNNSGFQSTWIRRIGISIFRLLNSLLIRQSITDNTSGFRAYNKKAIDFLSDNYPSDYPEPEAIILLGKNGFRLKELPVEMQHRGTGSSSIGRLQAVYYMCKVVLSVLMCATRKKIKRSPE